MLKISAFARPKTLEVQGATLKLKPAEPSQSYEASGLADILYNEAIKMVGADEFANQPIEKRLGLRRSLESQAFLQTYLDEIDGIEIDGGLDPLSSEGIAFMQMHRPSFLYAVQSALEAVLEPKPREKKGSKNLRD